MTIWYILCSLVTFFPVLVSCNKKNLATLVHTFTRRGASVGLRPVF
jgi:hypothetical protein